MPDLSEPHQIDFGPLKAKSCTRALAADAPPPSRRPIATLRIDASSRAQRHDGQMLPAVVTGDAQLKTRRALGQLWVTPDRHSRASFKPHDLSKDFRTALLGSRATPSPDLLGVT